MKIHSHCVSRNVNLTILLAVFFITCFLLPAVNAESYKVNNPANLQFLCTLNNAIPSSSATFNVTISYPNSSIWINNQKATPQGQGNFNYSITPVLTGTYKILEYCYDGSYSFSNTEYVDITGNGKPEASGAVIVLFSIIFLIVAGGICWLSIVSLGHLLSLDFDILDFAKNFGMYAIIIVLMYLEMFYVGNPVMDGFLLMLVQWSWMFFILIPMIALILSLTIGSLQKKSMNVRMPQNSRRRII